MRVCSGILQYLKDPTISPILTSTLIAAGTVSFNLVAGLVTEKKRADLTLEVGIPNLVGQHKSVYVCSLGLCAG